MSYNGSGTFQINSTGQPVVSGTVISSTAFNALTADLATGLSTAITKDGQTATTARIPFAAGINSTLVTDSTSTTTGSIITAGGAGIAKALYVGTTANVAGAVTLQSTLGVTGITTFSAQPIFSSLTASSAVATDASKGLVSVTNTGTGNNVLATSPTITTPTISGDASVSGLTVGKGAGAVSTNTAVGASALAANQAGGTNNTAIGNAALDANTTGDGNTAVGDDALGANTTAGNNTAVGYGAGATFNGSGNTYHTFVGANAGRSTTTGDYNTALGGLALYSNTTASNNTAVGYQAGNTITVGVNNTYIGSNAAASSAGADQELVVCTGNGATGKGANTAYIYGNGGSTFNGKNSATWDITSDQRLKKNIVDNNTGLSAIAAICVRNFEYRLPEEVTDLPQNQAIAKTGVQLGVIAQELQAVLPDCVKTESTGVMTVDTDNLTWYLVNAIKELKAEIDILKGQA